MKASLRQGKSIFYTEIMIQNMIWKCQKGVSLIEVLVGLVLLAVVCVSAFGFFSTGLGGIAKEGNRRAALERARERMEQVFETDPTLLAPRDGAKYWCSSGNPCTNWSGASSAQTVAVNNLANQRMETTLLGIHDTSAGTPATFYDAWEIGVKVWFTPNINNDDDYNRVYIKSLRAP